MLVVMSKDATSRQLEDVIKTIVEMGLQAHPLPGSTRTAIGITGNTGAVDSRQLEVLAHPLAPARAELLHAMLAYNSV